MVHDSVYSVYTVPGAKCKLKVNVATFGIFVFAYETWKMRGHECVVDILFLAANTHTHSHSFDTGDHDRHAVCVCLNE